MDARKVILSFAVMAICAVVARPQDQQSAPSQGSEGDYNGQAYSPQYQNDQPQYQSDQPQFQNDQPQYQGDQPQFASDQPQFASDQPQFASDQPQTDFQPTPSSQPQQYDGRQERQTSSRSKRYIPYGAYSTYHTYSYLTPYPNSIRSIHYAPPVYAAAAYHAPIQPIYY